MAVELIKRTRAQTLKSALLDPGIVIGSNRLYWISGTLLIAVGLVMSAWPFLLMINSNSFESMMHASMLGQLSYILIFPWFCLLGGRLRDAGHNPVWFIGILIAWSLVSSIIMAIFMMGALFEDMPALIEGLEAEAPLEDDPDFDAMMEMQGEIMGTIFRKTFWPIHIVSALSSLAVLGLLALMPSRADDNEYLWKRRYVPPKRSA